MASSLPIPAPPRTPTPPTPIPEDPNGDGLGIGSSRTVQSTVVLNPNALSPLYDSFSPRFGGMSSPMLSSGGPTPTLGGDGLMPLPVPGGPAPFNFQPQTIKGRDNPGMSSSVTTPSLTNRVPYSSTRTPSPGIYVSYSPTITVNGFLSFAPEFSNHEQQQIGKRRGHRYKHSSVSAQHQIFLEPPPRARLALPASLPVPTYKEAWASRSKEQTTRIAWCACHALVAAYVLYSAAGSLALTALSHLIFFDAISATICVVVDVLCNFEVWKRSSIRHPFGLERAEVLAGFAMSVFLLFMGFDLISHNLQHVLEGLGSHQPHHPHSHERVSPGSVDSAALLSIVSTLISAFGLQNHARIGKTMRFSALSSLPGVLSNPSHFLTLSCSAIMLLLPLLTITFYLWLDRLLCAVIAVSMFVLGVRLATMQGLMLLMSYSPSDKNNSVSSVMQEISREPLVVKVEEAKFWQVHYGLCMANLKLRVTGDDASLQKLRDRVNYLVKNQLGGGYGKGTGVKWEVTTQFSLDRVMGIVGSVAE